MRSTRKAPSATPPQPMAVAAPVSMRLSLLVRITASSAAIITLLAFHATPPNSTTSPCCTSRVANGRYSARPNSMRPGFPGLVCFSCAALSFLRKASSSRGHRMRLPIACAPSILSHCTTSATESCFESPGSEQSGGARLPTLSVPAFVASPPILRGTSSGGACAAGFTASTRFAFAGIVSAGVEAGGSVHSPEIMSLTRSERSSRADFEDASCETAWGGRPCSCAVPPRPLKDSTSVAPL